MLLLLLCGKNRTENWFVGTSFEFDSSRGGLDQKVSDELISLITSAAGGGGGRGGDLQGQSEAAGERVGVAHNKSTRSLIPQQCDGCALNFCC